MPALLPPSGPGKDAPPRKPQGNGKGKHAPSPTRKLLSKSVVFASADVNYFSVKIGRIHFRGYHLGVAGMRLTTVIGSSASGSKSWCSHRALPPLAACRQFKQTDNRPPCYLPQER
jgi:hypothetical protein